MSSGMRTITIIVSHSDFVDLLSTLISLECIEPFEPNVTLDPVELTDMISKEAFSLENFDANMDSIPLLATGYTYTLRAWLPDLFEEKILSVLSGLNCSWDIADPQPDEIDNMPVFAKRSQIFGKFRNSGRRHFAPLAKADGI